MNLETLEEKLVWALTYAAVESSTPWHGEAIVSNEMMAERADAAVIQFRQRCPNGSGSVSIIQMIREGMGKKNG